MKKQTKDFVLGAIFGTAVTVGTYLVAKLVKKEVDKQKLHKKQDEFLENYADDDNLEDEWDDWDYTDEDYEDIKEKTSSSENNESFQDLVKSIRDKQVSSDESKQ